MGKDGNRLDNSKGTSIGPNVKIEVMPVMEGSCEDKREVYVMAESDGLRLGRAAISRVFRTEPKLKEFLRQMRDLHVNLETCHFGQVESVIRELCPPAAAIAMGRPIVVSYQDLPDNEDDVLEQSFRNELDQARRKYPTLFK